MMRRLLLTTFAVVSVLALTRVSPAPAQTVFSATLTGAQETPPNGSTATGSATLTLNAAMTQLSFNVNYFGLSGTGISGAHIHNAPTGVPGGIVKNIQPFGPGGFPNGSFGGVWTSTDATEPLTPFLVGELNAGRLYFNIHTSPSFGGGEIRGQILPSPVPVMPGTWSRIKTLYM
jgi:hypothetical protein